MKMKCISNKIKGMQYYGGNNKNIYTPYGCADEYHDWLEVGKVYEITQITGQMYYDTTTGKTVDMLTIKYEIDGRIGVSNVPATLFKDLNRWRIKLINKLLKWPR